ncbi:alpha-mannosidase I MNS4 [Andrographis paniculata]|uniref:alpha-mannosidase I MNS4 n=1 Tax=Andrographis paniculata TaxID=175694 RepID=UPI0021E97E51|nr:alpha-mannosidase I MNS4 [Andrographis paniculata]
MGVPRKKYLWLILLILSEKFVCGVLAESVSKEEAKLLRDEVRDMFYHAFDGYMKHAFPRDELKPLSCGGEDTLGGYALTLIDSLDTLALLGDREQFTSSVEWIGKNLRFDINKTVSIFETTIRILGGLLSAHLVASDYNTGMRIPSYDDELLHLAEDLARRMLPAFDTPTGIPFGSVNLMHGVDENESKITSTAGGGTLTLEFGVLSRLTNDPIFEQVTKNAVRGLWARRSRINLVGAHIDVFSGEWTQKDAGIGTSIDSFYEYLLKAYLLFGDEEYLFIFQEAYKAAMLYLYNDPWYVEVNMNSAALVWPLFNSLQAFWPGLQVLAGDIEPAIKTHAAFFSVWKRYGFTPEGFNLATFNVQQGQKSYPLRPELIESTYWLYKATRNPRFLDAGRDMLASLQYGARCTCGYCHISDVEFHQQEDHMESFFLAETVKYLWLLFDLAAGPDNLVENGPYRYIFSTEGHLLPATPQISLVHEHCAYLGAYCRSIQETDSHDTIKDSRGTNHSESFTDTDNINFQSWPSFHKPRSLGLMKGFCPGLMHGQKYGVSYISSDNPIVDESASTRQGPVVENSPTVILISSNNSDSPSGDVSESNKDVEENQLPVNETTENVEETDAESGGSSEDFSERE